MEHDMAAWRHKLSILVYTHTQHACYRNTFLFSCETIKVHQCSPHRLYEKRKSRLGTLDFMGLGHWVQILTVFLRVAQLCIPS